MKRDDVLKIQGAEVCAGNAGVIKLPLSEFRKVMEGLRNDPQSPMDFLREIVGMDWGEEGLGAVYFMESTVTGDTVAIRTATTDREEAYLPTVSDLWKTALIKEREVYDFFGIRFIGHPDMRRLFLREDWIGWPLRKDYDMNSNPLRLDNEINADITKEYRLMPDGTLQGFDNQVFGEDDFVVSMGPQHPSTHGALRMRIALDGEFVKKVRQEGRPDFRIHPPRHREDERKPDLSADIGHDRPLGLFERASKPPCVVHVYRAGCRHRNLRPRQIHPYHHGRAATY